MMQLHKKSGHTHRHIHQSLKVHNEVLDDVIVWLHALPDHPRVDLEEKQMSPSE